jgi:hypothetical protein
MRKITLNILFFLVSMAALSAQQNPSITIVNNTGHTIWYVYISLTTSDDWGSDRLGSGKTIPDGSSASLQLPSPINVVNQYDIGLKDSNGDIYTKFNVQVSANARIVFTSDDYDNDLTKANYSGPSITIVNNTGYTIWYVFISDSDSDSWGRDKLGDDETIPNGGSVSLQLPYPIDVENQYDIELQDSDGDTYTKYNVLVSANARIVFTFDDFDDD